jgi:hypothetical protein
MPENEKMAPKKTHEESAPNPIEEKIEVCIVTTQ